MYVLLLSACSIDQSVVFLCCFFLVVDKISKACHFQLCHIPPGLLWSHSLWAFKVKHNVFMTVNTQHT